MNVQEESEKAGLKLITQKTNIMASSPTNSWQIDGKKVETVTNFILEGFKITADGIYSHSIKRHLLLRRKAMTNLYSALKSRDITLPTEVRTVFPVVVFLVVMYRCDIWTIKNAERQKFDAFKLWCWRRPLKRPDCKKIKLINPKGNKPWKFIGRTDAEAEPLILWPPDAKSWLMAKILILGRIEGRRSTWQKMRWLNDTTDSIDMSWNKLGGCKGQGSIDTQTQH